MSEYRLLEVTPVTSITYELWNPVSVRGTIEPTGDKNGLELVFKWNSADRRQS
jgi:hypothetical protein